MGTARGEALQHGWATLAPSHLAWEQRERGLPGQALSTAGSLEPPPYTRSPLLHPAGLWRQPPAGRPVFGAPQTDTAQQAECKLKCKLAHAAPWQRLLSLSAALSMKQKAGSALAPLIRDCSASFWAVLTERAAQGAEELRQKIPAL